MPETYENVLAGAPVGSGSRFATQQYTISAQTVEFPVTIIGMFVNESTVPIAARAGQQTMANSMGVVLPSDQAAIPVTESGTWTVQPGNTPNTTPWLMSIHDGTTKATVRDLTSNDALNVAVVDATGAQITSFGGGTQYAVDAALGATPTGTLAIAIRDDALSALVPIEGDAIGLRVDVNGALWVIPSGTTTISGTVTVNAGTGFASLAVTGGGVEATALRVTIANDSTGLVSVDDNGSSLTVDNGGTFVVQVDGAALTSLQLIDNLVLAEDAAHVTADPGVQLLAVRKATAVNLSGADGDYEPLQVSAGRLWASATIDAAIPAGTNNIGDVDVLTTVNATNATASNALGALNAAVTISGQGSGTIHWEIDTGTLAGTVVAEATLDDTNWFSVNVIENDGTISSSFTAFGKRGLFVTGGYSQVRLRVSVYTSGTSNARLEAADASSVVRLGQALPTGTNAIGKLAANSGVDIGDVDVTSVVPGTGATNLGKAEDVASADGDVGVGMIAVRKATPANTSGTDGDYEFLQMAAGRLWVDASGITLTVGSHAVTNAGTFAVQVDGAALTSLQLIDDAVSGAGFNISQMNGIAVTMGNGASGTGVQRVTIANDSTGVLATVTTVTTCSTVTTLTGSGVAHDAVDSGNPHKIGAKATTSLSGLTLVANADRTDLFAGVDGVLVVRKHCNLEDQVQDRATNTDGAATAFTGGLAAPGAGIRLWVTKITVSNSSATNITVDIRDGVAGAVLWTIPCPANGGAIEVFDPPLKFTANTAVAYDGSAAVTTLSVSAIGFKSKV